MTNIINGIDVSECSYYNKDNEPYCCEVWDNECEAQNCYFKQFKCLQKENEKLKEQLNIYMSQYEIKIPNKYRQALEEIRKEANRLLFEENPIYGYNNSNYFEILAKYVLAKTNEALNDRD